MFENTVMPATILLGSSAGPVWDVEVIEYGQGSRYVNRRVNQSRYRFTVRHVSTRDDVYSDIVNFFTALGGPSVGFLVDNWLDNSTNQGGTITALDMPIGTGDGSTKTFNLIKTYTAGSTSTTRRIFKPKTGTVQIGVASASPIATPTVVYDGSPSEPAGGSVNVDTTTGVITFGTAPGVGEAITWGGQFYIPVALEGNTLDIVGPDKWYEIGNLNLIELLNPNA